MELKEYLNQNDISVLDFSEEIGISFSAVYGYLMGRGRPTRANAQKIEKATRGIVTAKEMRAIKPRKRNDG
jgi:transcriptional regulator with XRE-family HTH domain